MRLARRLNPGLAVPATLFGLTCLLILPGLPVGRASTTPIVPVQKGGSRLDSARQAALEKLHSQLKNGDPFSEEEADILRRFASGSAITELEADLVISRVLFDFYIAGRELTKEQQELLDQYKQFVAHRSTNVDDLKRESLNKRIAAAANAPPRSTPLVAPPNDSCAGAEVIPAAGPFPYLTAVTADITDATLTGDPPVPSCQDNLSRSIWYTFAPSATATYTISSCSAAPTGTTVDDTIIAIYTSTGGCGGPFTELPITPVTNGCSDDELECAEVLQSIITTQLNAGTTYYIVVWEFDPVAPTAGNTAVQLRVTQALVPANDTCSTATTLALNIPVAGLTSFANNDYQLSGAACFTGTGQTSSGAGGRDVVYSFTATSAGSYSFKVTKYNFSNNLVLYVANPPCPPGPAPSTVGTCLGASNRGGASAAEEVSCLALSAAQQVFIYVDENALTGGSSFTIEVSRCFAESEPNNTPATADTYIFGSAGSLTAADADFYSLGALATGARVFALIDGISSNTVDYDLRVTTTVDTLEYDDGNADVPFGSVSATVGGTPIPAGGSVFLRVNHFSSLAAEPYRLYAAVQPPGGNAIPGCPAVTTSATAETEPNNTTAQANSAANKYFRGSLSGPAPSTDVDVFSFTASGGEIIFLGLDADPCRDSTPINARLELLDSGGGILLAVNDGATTSNTTSGAGSLTPTTPISPAEAIVFRAATSGTYFARVLIGTTSSTGLGAGDYLLSIFTGGPTVAKFSNNGLSSAADAIRFDDGVSVRWRTGFEIDNLGFNLYRDENGKRVRVNSQLIAGSALVVGSGTTMGAGKSYAWFDAANSNRPSQYLIEAVDLNGESTWYGPVSPNQAGDKSAPGHQASSLTVGQLGKSNPIESQTTLVDRRPGIRMTGASGVSIQSVIGGQPAAKLSVKKEGYYRVTQPELAAAGFNPGVDPRFLRLLVDGQEQPINVISKGFFDSSSAIEFYGLGVDSAATDEHVYWLTVGAQPGQRIQSITSPANPGLVQSFLSTVELKQRTIYFAGLRNGEKENFFGPLVARDPVDQTLTLQHVDSSASNGATLEIALQGVSLGDHRVEAHINGVRAGEVVFSGQKAGVAQLGVPQSLLKEGANSVRLLPVGGSSDISLVDYVRIAYWHTFVADNNELRFTASAKQVISVGGFGDGAIRVLDVTNPNAPVEVIGAIRPDKSSYSVTINVPGSGLRTLVALTNDAAKRPADVTLDRPSSWRQSANAANLVIFTRPEFMLALEPLKTLRQSQGYKVAVVDVEDAYDEFSFGNKTPQALKEFLAYARSNWKIAPRFVMLAGDASVDAKNYLGFGWNDLVPARLIDTQLMETASDDWLADFNGDGLAEMAIGRLPIRTQREAAALVAKIIGYDRSAPSDGVLLVADDGVDGIDFEATNSELRGLIPDDQRVQEINRGGLDSATARSRLLDAINRGQKIVNYSGHGNVDTWRGAMFRAEDVNELDNSDRLPLFVMMTCLNGYFQDAQLDSLAESLLRAEKGGAIALWASTGMTQPGDQGVMNVEMFKRLFDHSSLMTLGEIAVQAKAKTLNTDARLSWVLFGDPTTRLR